MFEKVSRFAPSPSGRLHIGGAMSALYTYLMIKNMGGKLMMRIDDTDTFRSNDFHCKKIIEALQWLGIEWEPGEVMRQSERLPIYHEVAESMIASGSAFPCFCDKDKLSDDRQKFGRRGKPFVYDGTCRNIPQEEASRRMAKEKYTIRIKNMGHDLIFKDMILGNKKFEGTQFGDFVIMRNDGWPTYNFATVVDDLCANITHVARGSDNMINTPKQLIVYDAVGCNAPRFAHFPLVISSRTGKKMSKRDPENMSVCDYMKSGITLKQWQRTL